MPTCFVFLKSSTISLIFDHVSLHMQEYLENGPLFSELKFYQRAAKPENSE